MKIADILRKVTNQTDPEYFVPGALVKRRDKFSSIIGTVKSTATIDGKELAQVTWTAGDGVRFEPIKNLIPAEHEQKFVLGDLVVIIASRAVGRISNLATGNSYSVELNRGGYEHNLSADKLRPVNK